VDSNERSFVVSQALGTSHGNESIVSQEEGIRLQRTSA